MWIVNSSVIAHAAAYSLGIIHRDISAGNTLLWKDRDGEWYGLLNDWELSQRHNVDYGENRQPDRTVRIAALFTLMATDPCRSFRVPGSSCPHTL